MFLWLPESWNQSSACSVKLPHDCENVKFVKYCNIIAVNLKRTTAVPGDPKEWKSFFKSPKFDDITYLETFFAASCPEPNHLEWWYCKYLKILWFCWNSGFYELGGYDSYSEIARRSYQIEFLTRVTVKTVVNVFDRASASLHHLGLEFMWHC